MTIQDIVEHLRREEGFAGSYNSVWNYIHRRAHDDENSWERAYDLIIHLPKPRALDLIRRLSRGYPPAYASAQLRSFIREAACPRMAASTIWPRRAAPPAHCRLDGDLTHRPAAAPTARTPPRRVEVENFPSAESLSDGDRRHEVWFPVLKRVVAGETGLNSFGSVWNCLPCKPSQRAPYLQKSRFSQVN